MRSPGAGGRSRQSREAEIITVSQGEVLSTLKKTLVGGFGCDELVLYGIRVLGEQLLKSSIFDGEDCTFTILPLVIKLCSGGI